MKIFIAQLNYIVGDLDENTKKIIDAIYKAKEKKADIVLFSELAICGYPPEDLLYFEDFEKKIHLKLEEIISHTKDIFVVVGLIRKNPSKQEKDLYNSAAIICDGKLLGYKDKTLLPDYDVFKERRYFEPGKEEKIFQYKNKKISVLICEDAWQHGGKVHFTKYLKDPVLDVKPLHPDIVLNLAASPFYFEKRDVRLHIYEQTAKTLNCPVIVCNQVGANDELVFDGYSMFFDKEGILREIGKGFEEDFLLIDLEKKEKEKSFITSSIEDLYHSLVLGVKDYFRKQNLKKACIGLSGGIDSALVCCIAQQALGKENVLAVNMPSRFSSFQGIEDSNQLANNLDIKLIDIPIDKMFQEFLDLLSPVFFNTKPNIAEENLQARIRGIILMAISNKLGHIVLSTGNKSEMAMGYSTLYGDMCGGLGVLADVAKTQVYQLANWINKDKEIIPLSIIEKPPSAELKENQKDEDDLPAYKIVDTVLKDYVEEHRSSREIVDKRLLKKELVDDLVRRIHLAEYKRRQSPIGIRVSKKSFSKGRYFPIVQKWIKDRLEEEI
jgi:NAD+ synthase (glutamine-hydrolysing)